MKLGIIVGSMQHESNSAKVGRYLKSQAESLGHEVFSVDLGKDPLPMWGSTVQGDDQWTARFEQLTSELAACQGFVIISPEYHGMVPPALKNVFLHFGSNVFGHKPGFLVGVSAGVGGSYPIAELRLSSTKNNRLCYTPEHCIVRHAGKVLNQDHAANDAEADAHTRQRLDYGLTLLLEYAKALVQVRDSGVIDFERFTNGM